jgi:hypothetical protein
LKRFPLPLAWTLRLEVGVALLVLVAAGLLTATPVPVPDFSQNQAPAPRASQEVNGYTVTQTITPGGPGVNASDIQISYEGQPTDDLTVQVQQVYPGRDLRRDWQPADTIGNGLYISSDGGIDRPGAWWTLVDLRATDGTLTRAAFAWDIRADAAVIDSEPPGIQHLLALALVVAVLGWISYPTLMRLFARLELNPTTATIATLAIIGTVILMGFSTAMVNDLSQRNLDALDPVPQFINSVLPDQASLDRGKALFDDHCAAWMGETFAGDVKALGERLPALRDDAVLDIIGQGWRSLPACQGDLSELQRWDLVNYLRTMEA